MGRCSLANRCEGYTRDTYVCDYSQDYDDSCFRPKPGSFLRQRREWLGIWLFCLGISLAAFWLSAWQGYMTVALINGAVIWWITEKIFSL